MAKSKEYTAEDLIKRLRNKYDPAVAGKKSHDRHVLLEQVGSGTGWRNEGWVDAVVIDMWPSDGLTRRAFEIKISRQDFLSEQQNHKKNQWARDYCHEFWYVAPKGVIKEGELRDGDGWMCPHGDTLRIVKAAVRRKPEMDDSFVASIARSLVKERNKKVKEVASNLHKSDPKHLEAMAYQNAARKFISEHHSLWHVDKDDKEDAIYDLLVKANASEKIKKEAVQMERHMRSFQETMLELWDTMTIMAFIGITEVDERGEFLMKYLGDGDMHLLGLRRLRDAKWYKKQSRYYRKAQKDKDKQVKSSWEVITTRAKTLLGRLK